MSHDLVLGSDQADGPRRPSLHLLPL